MVNLDAWRMFCAGADNRRVWRAWQRELDDAALAQWSVEDGGKIMAPDQRKYRSLRDALRAYQYAVSGAIGREDIYFLAILRRRLVERELPLQDGPIAVVALGRVVPEPLFHTSKKLFPVRVRTVL